MSRISRTAVLNAVSMVVFALLVGAAAWYVGAHRAEFSAIRKIGAADVGLVGGASLLYFLLQGLILRAVVRPFGVRLRFGEWFGIVMATLMGNFVFPFGGLGLRAAYLKRTHRFPYTDFVSSLGATYVVEFLVFTVGGMLGLAWVFFRRGTFDVVVAGLLAAMLAACLSVILLPAGWMRSEIRGLRTLSQVAQSWEGLRRDRRLLIQVAVLTVLEFLAVSLMFFAAFHAVDTRLMLPEMFVASCLSDYAFIIRVLPASFGFYEGSVVYSARLAGCGLSEGLLAVSLVRICNFALFFTLGPYFSYVLLKRGKYAEGGAVPPAYLGKTVRS